MPIMTLTAELSPPTNQTRIFVTDLVTKALQENRDITMDPGGAAREPGGLDKMVQISPISGHLTPDHPATY